MIFSEHFLQQKRSRLCFRYILPMTKKFSNNDLYDVFVQSDAVFAHNMKTVLIRIQCYVLFDARRRRK